MSIVWLALLLQVASPAVGSDSRATEVGISGGVLQFDLSGTGNTPLFSLHVDRRVLGDWAIGANVSFARPKQQFGSTTLFIPEGQIQYQWQLGRVHPFAGGAVGSTIDFRDDFDGGIRSNLTLSGFGGARVFIKDNFGARGEFRIRGVGTNFFGSSAEYRGGLFWRL